MSSDWRDRAACRGMDPELWFPVAEDPKTPEDKRRIRIAKQTCGGCPVALECLVYSLQRPEQYGIWAGMSERTRRSPKGRAIRRRVLAMA